MRKLASTLIAASLLLVGAGLVRPGEDKDARAIIDKAIQAMGGEANLVKHNSATWKEKGTYYGMGEGLPYTSKMAVQWPMQFRMEIEGVFTIVLNGDKGWMHTGGETTELDKEQLAQQISDQRAGWISHLLPLKDKAYQLKTLGESKVGKQTALVVQVTRKDYPTVKLFFDKTTGLLLKNEFRTKAAEQKFLEVTQEIYFSDHREVDGAKVAHKVVLKRDGKLFVEAEISALKAGKVDDKVFGRPGKE